MKEEKATTEFASAERSPESEIKRQIELFSLPHLRRFIDYIPDFVLVLNKNRQIVFANKSVTPLFELTNITSAYGLRPGELIDCTHARENICGCGTSKFCRECGAVKAILTSLRGQEDIQECRITQKRSGDAVDLRVWAYPITLGTESFSIFVAGDISNEKRRTVLERIFLHDIMNTVSGIHGFAEILGVANPSMVEELRWKIHKSSMKLIDQIDAHRELVAAEANELPVHPVSIDSVALLQDVLNLYTESEFAKQRNILVDSNAQYVVFTSDKILLTRVLSNMVKNAVEASSSGDTIKLGVERIGEEIQFSVHNPSFMPSEVQLQVFQRSFSTKGLGRGLGTYSMRLLSERYLNGSISFTSSKKHGTAFIARYPLILD